jgi:hypothetical protein
MKMIKIQFAVCLLVLLASVSDSVPQHPYTPNELFLRFRYVI